MIQPGAARRRYANFVTAFAIETFDNLAPAGICVNFIKDQQTRRRGKPFAPDIMALERQPGFGLWIRRKGRRQQPDGGSRPGQEAGMVPRDDNRLLYHHNGKSQ